MGVEINSSEVSFEILFAAKFSISKKFQILSFQYVGFGYDKNWRLYKTIEGLTQIIQDTVMRK